MWCLTLVKVELTSAWNYSGAFNIEHFEMKTNIMQSQFQVYQRRDTHAGWNMTLPGLLNWNMDLKKSKKLPNCDATTLKFLQSQKNHAGKCILQEKNAYWYISTQVFFLLRKAGISQLHTYLPQIIFTNAICEKLRLHLTASLNQAKERKKEITTWRGLKILLQKYELVHWFQKKNN